MANNCDRQTRSRKPFLRSFDGHSSSFHHVLLFTIFLLFVFEAYAGPPVEQDALLDMKQSWTDPTFALSSWIKGNDCSTWNGVKCDSNGNVIQIDMKNIYLPGPISSSIGKLNKIQYIDLSHNKISGPIPSSIGNLKNIQYMSFYDNFLSGSIPSSLGDLSSIEELWFGYNKLTGSIPSSIGNLNGLKSLDFRYNLLSGPIPSSIGNMKSLSGVSIESNYLSGTPSICGANFRYCDTSNNCFVGIGNQKTFSDCFSFCGANSASGPCNGHGTCAFNAQNKPTCTCDPGITTSDCMVPQEKLSPPPINGNSPPSSSSNDFRTIGLYPELRNMVNRNPYFRYASYNFNGNEDDPNWNLIATKDWTKYNNAPVIDQEDCNACWAIAPTVAVEYLLSISNRGSKPLSEQQILDCLGRNKSCDGGWPTDAFEYLTTNGVANDLDYSPVYRHQKCRANKDPKFQNVKISMYEEVNFYGSFGLILAVQNQPVVVNIQSSEPVFQNYNKNSGIMDSEDCFKSVVDHTVVVIGYNLFKGTKPYWIIRNSWGKAWGEEGYMRLAYTGGLGICGIHSTPALYPVLSPNGKTCGIPNPCGSGKCSVDSKTGLNKCSQCPPTFVVVQNLDKSESCAPMFICTQKSSNPCGVGACVNDMKGNYTCICPIGYIQTQFSDNNQNTCREASSIQSVLFYTVETMIDCSVISLSFGLSLQDFKNQNKKIDCNNLVPASTKVNVTQNSKWAGCAIKYSWNNGDTCKSVASMLNINLNYIKSLNPDLDCTDIPLGSQVCIKEGKPPVRAPLCGKYHNVSDTDTCQSIVALYKLNFFEFLVYNPGLNCASLVPRASIPIYGQEVCVDTTEPFGQSNKKCKNGKVEVKKYDTCMRILIKFFKGSPAAFKKQNYGFTCFSRQLKIGETFCK